MKFPPPPTPRSEVIWGIMHPRMDTRRIPTRYGLKSRNSFSLETSTVPVVTIGIGSWYFPGVDNKYLSLVFSVGGCKGKTPKAPLPSRNDGGPSEDHVVDLSSPSFSEGGHSSPSRSSGSKVQSKRRHAAREQYMTSTSNGDGTSKEAKQAATKLLLQAGSCALSQSATGTDRL